MKISLTLLFITISIIVNGQYVEDKAKFLSKKETENLNAQIQQIKNQTTGEILIYTTESLNGKEVKDVAQSIFSEYGIGKKGVNNGVLFFLAKEEAEIQILTGYGVEWIMTDNESRIIIDSMINYFKKGSFYNGLNYGLTKVGNKLSSVSWSFTEKPIDSISQKDEGKIIKFIMHKTPQTKFEYATEDGPPVSN